MEAQVPVPTFPPDNLEINEIIGKFIKCLELPG